MGTASFFGQYAPEIMYMTFATSNHRKLPIKNENNCEIRWIAVQELLNIRMYIHDENISAAIDQNRENVSYSKSRY